MLINCWISPTNNSSKKLWFQDSLHTFQINCLNSTFLSCWESMCMHTHSHRAPYSKIHFIKISHSEFPGLAQTSWYHSAAGYPLSFLKIFLRLPYLHPRWLELVSRLPCPFSAWAALTRRELGAGCSSSPCGDRLGAFLWEREWYIIYVLSKILENICYPRRQIFIWL